MGNVRRKPDETRAERIIRWIHEHCRIPEGKDVGQPVRLRDWQQKFIRDVYDQPTRRAIFTVGRKNAKTSLSAFLLLANLCGPEARFNSQLYSAAQSRDQASLIFKLAAKIVRMSPTISEYVIVRDTIRELYCSELGTLYKALAADASTAYGLSPVFTVHDELGQVRGPRSELYDALETATGAQENPLSIIISTQAPTDGDLLSILIDDAKAGHDPRVRLLMYTADMSLDPFSEEAIMQANPAFGDFQNAEEVRAMAEDARRMPSREAEYRNLVLNQRVTVHQAAFSRERWEACATPVIGSFKGKPVYAGLDLSATTDLTALVLIAPHEGKWHVKPTFWLPGEGLRERSRVDRVEYDVWHKMGFLETTPGASIEYEYVAERLRGLFDTLDIRQLAFDRWNMRHLRPWLVKCGFTDEELERFIDFGQGYKSMSPALRDLESDIVNGKIAHGGHPVLNMCAQNAVAEMDPAGNRKLSKAKSHSRIDGVVALTMARAVAATEELKTAPSYQMFFA